MNSVVQDVVRSDEEDKGCLHFGEDSDEAVKARVLLSPSPPSRQEMLEHNINHMPFRTWCPHCVAGRANTDKHSAGGGLAGSETPVASMGYTFMGDKNANGNETVEEEGRSSDEKYKNENKDETKAKILVIRDAK